MTEVLKNPSFLNTSHAFPTMDFEDWSEEENAVLRRLVKDIKSELGKEDILELLDKIFQVAGYEGKEFIERALERERKISISNDNIEYKDAGRPSKAEKIAYRVNRFLQRDLSNPRALVDGKHEIEELTKDVSRPTEWKARKILREEHGIEIEKPLQNLSLENWESVVKNKQTAEGGS